MSLWISSAANPRIKEVLKLEKRQVRDLRQATVVEGMREVSRALAAGIIPQEAYVCPELVHGDSGRALVRRLEQLDAQRVTQLSLVSPEVFDRLVVRQQSGGIVLVTPYVRHSMQSLQLAEIPFVVIIEGVEKPGNLGAILRTADAAGVDAVIVTAGATDIHNPNVVRASLGTLFTLPVVEAEPTEIIGWLADHGINIVAAAPDAECVYTKIDMRGPVALVMGSEAWGLSEAWRSAASHLVRIPMHGAADSLNLATATALLLYEVVRQRQDEMRST